MPIIIAIKNDYLIIYCMIILVLTADNVVVRTSVNAKKLHGKHANPTTRKPKTGNGAYDIYLLFFQIT